MNIKTDKKAMNVNISKFVLGTDKKDLKGYVFGPTLLLWIIGIVIALLIYLFNDDILFIDVIYNTSIVFAIVGFILALLSLIGMSDFDYDDGWNIWRRVVVYNVVFLLFSLYMSKNVEEIIIKEPVTHMTFVTTDINECIYSIELKSEHLNYKHCDNSNTTYTFIRDMNPQINIVAKKRNGVITGGNIEIIDKKVSVNTNKNEKD